MQIIKKHFNSFNSFIKLLYSLRIRLLNCFNYYFGTLIHRRLVKSVDASVSNSLFLLNINKSLSIPENIFEFISKNEVILIQSEADRSIQNIYNMLGSGDIKLDPIDWHIDFKSGYRWNPGKFYKDYIQEGIDSNSDVKLPRELSRSHHFVKLGLAYRNTKDEKYADFCISQMEDWIQENPLMRSINWGCTMDVAIRAVNWIWALDLISGSKALTNEVVSHIKASLFEHGWFIYRNPENGSVCNHNHYLADLCGQIHLALLFHNLDEPQKWLEAGKKELFNEIRLQILPSGMSYERSTNYNRLVLELLIVPVLLLKRNGHEIPQDIWYRLEKMFEFLMYSLKPDGTSPIIGDQDDARLLPFGTEINIDYRYLLSLGAILFNRSDFKLYGDRFNIYCSILGGPKAELKYSEIPPCSFSLKSVAFPDAGLYIMRDDNNYLLYNATGKGLYPELPVSTHTHSDLLSFELFVKGKSFLVDSGSYVYTANARQRMLFRSTQMHNTVTVDGESQNVIREDVLWNFDRNAIPEVICWQSDENSDKIIATHNGYSRLAQPVIHKRSIIFDKQLLKWTIEDELAGKGNHLFEWFFHFDPGINFLITSYKVYTNCIDGNNISISFSGVENIQFRKETTFVSKAYGEKTESLVLIASLNSGCPIKVKIVISPKE